MEVCREIRKKYEMPIIMLTAKDSEIDKVLGLELGADDYVTKPFSTRELIARVKANLRRHQQILSQPDAENETNEIEIGSLVIHPDAYVVSKRGETIELTHREFELLYYLAKHIGQVMTREHLLQTVWGYDYYGDVRTVDVTVRRLREKIEDSLVIQRGLSLAAGLDITCAILNRSNFFDEKGWFLSLNTCKVCYHLCPPYFSGDANYRCLFCPPA